MRLDPQRTGVAALVVGAVLVAGYALGVRSGLEAVAVYAGAVLMVVGVVALLRRPRP